MDYDICIIGSGAGGAPIAYELSKKGKAVIVLEKGSWLTEKDFTKDEISCVRRNTYTPRAIDEPNIVEDKNEDGDWKSASTYESGSSFLNGSLVGGSSNLMSGYFHRLKPKDFRLLSEFGEIPGANIVDWPISYNDLEPYYTKVERLIGVSGEVKKHKFLEPRSTKNFPQKPLQTNHASSLIDIACNELGYNAIPTSRAILSKPKDGRNSCAYTNFCGSYPCHTGAKGSSRASLLDKAVKTGNCTILPNSKAFYIETDDSGNAKSVKYYDNKNNIQTIKSKIVVIASQAIETSRILLNSKSKSHPNGIGNKHDQVGKNIIFSAGGMGSGEINYSKYKKEISDKIKIPGLFINRALQDWYYINDKKLGGKVKGGTIDFLFEHANPIKRANSVKYKSDSKLLWGLELKEQLKNKFTQQRTLNFEVFNDWLPTDNCFVSLDKTTKDKWGDWVAKIRIGYHEHDLKIGEFISKKAVEVFEKMGLENINYSVSGYPSSNLVAGGCRFGDDPKTSVLDKNCRVHNTQNIYVSDGSFMPTGGSVPPTFTVYANSFRVADAIVETIQM